MKNQNLIEHRNVRKKLMIIKIGGLITWFSNSAYMGV